MRAQISIIRVATYENKKWIEIEEFTCDIRVWAHHGNVIPSIVEMRAEIAISIFIRH